MAGREGKRGECQTLLILVWRETGAVRNARPSRGRAASTRKRRSGKKKRSYLEFGEVELFTKVYDPLQWVLGLYRID